MVCSPQRRPEAAGTIQGTPDSTLGGASGFHESTSATGARLRIWMG
jgi:hypothetical protein